MESVVTTYHLYYLFGIIYKGFFYNLNLTLKYWLISKTINIRGNFIWKWHSVSLFTLLATFEVNSYIFVLKYFNCSNSLVPLFLLLCPNIHRQYNQIQMEMVEPCIRNKHQGKIIIADNVVILLSLITHFNLLPSSLKKHNIASYYTHSFF